MASTFLLYKAITIFFPPCRVHNIFRHILSFFGFISPPNILGERSKLPFADGLNEYREETDLQKLYSELPASPTYIIIFEIGVAFTKNYRKDIFKKQKTNKQKRLLAPAHTGNTCLL